MMILPLLLVLAAQAAPPPATSGAEQVLNPDKGDVEDSVRRAATRPLRDFNVMKTAIPPDLIAIMADPYAIKGLRDCTQLNAEVNRMTAHVGPDVDDPALIGRKGRQPVEQVADAAEGVTGGLIPGQGIIRQLSGANKAARQAAAARLAGQIRRSYIKGVMLARNCRLVPAPATGTGEARR